MPRTRSSRRTGGGVRQLPSGRWQVRYVSPDGARRTAPVTYRTRAEAETWLATTRADISRGRWRSPDLGVESLAEYLTAWLHGRRPELAPRTFDAYRRTAAAWITRPLPAPAGRRAVVDLGAMRVREVTAAYVRAWHAAAVEAARESATSRKARAGTGRGVGHPARRWAVETGRPVPSSGRLSAALLDEWRAAGEPGGVTLVPASSFAANEAGRTQVAHAYRLLRSVLGAAVDDGLLGENPCRIKRAGLTRPAERPTATPAQVQAIADAMPARYRAAVLVAAWSGLRAGELFALRRQDVDAETGALRVSRSLVVVAGEPIAYGPPKSHAGRRTVNLPRSVADELAEHMAEWTGREPGALVFATSSGLPLSAASRTRVFARARAQVGRPDLRWHDLRHTGATVAARAGATPAELQRRFGHSSSRAAAIYQHASDERDRDLAARLDDYRAATTSGAVVELRRAEVI